MERWAYDEFAHCGVDYSQQSQAKAYDENHQSLRDYDAEFASMLGLLGLRETSGLTALDIGCGTGLTSVQLATRFKKVVAIDVSEEMLAQAKERAARQGVTNIDFVHAGFLTYEHAGALADVVITKTALHHLPDFWKQIALLRMNAMLKPGGLLYLLDVVFNFEAAEHRGRINGWIGNFAKVVPPAFVSEIETHISSEFSTFRWILDEMLRRAAFSIEQWQSKDDFVAEYVCKKTGEIAL